MQAPKLPLLETKRLATLRAMRLLDTQPEVAFDRITRLAAHLLHVPIAVVSLVDEERQWFKSSVGLGVAETPRSISFCGHAILDDGLFEVEDAREDARFFDNPLVLGDPHLRFYAGQPLKAINGQNVGTLCLLAPEPRRLEPTERALLQDLGQIAQDLLRARELMQQVPALIVSESGHEPQFAVMPEPSAVGFMDMDTDGMIHAVNPQLCKMLDQPEALLLGFNFRDIAHPDDLPVVERALQRFRGNQNDIISIENRLIRRDGAVVWVHLNMLAHAKSTDTGERIRVTMKDASSRKAEENALLKSRQVLQDEVNRRTKALLESNLRLQQLVMKAQQAEATAYAAQQEAVAAMQFKGQFFVNMNHEIRTPLNGIIGMADLLLDTPLAADQRHYVDTSRICGQHLLSLVNDVLDLEKIESGKMTLELGPVNIRSLFLHQIDVFLPQVRAKGLHFESVIDPRLDRTVLADSGRLTQILLNYLSNAVKFTAHGTICIRAELVAAEAQSCLLKFSVQDSGIGVAAATLGRLFRPFTQADGTMARRFGGTGLGLCICKQLSALMGGEVGVESQEGVGSTFWFTAKLGWPEGDPPAAPAPWIAAGAIAAAHGHILVAEDNVVNQTVILAHLRRLGHTAAVVATGQAAIDALATAHFDLVLMDCQMPEMDGYQATQAIRAVEKDTHARIPIVALTAKRHGPRPTSVPRCRDGRLPRQTGEPRVAQADAEALGAQRDRNPERLNRLRPSGWLSCGQN